ncbi:hypothetical protein [Acinetobacter pragensis]|uniref:hypothetical protein n=1 Tax=Acinetobacter pragensis TaxID=1806892 RepID=UPI003341A295
MSDFEKAFSKLSKFSLENHTELWGEPKTERAFFEAGQASKQAEIDGLQLKNAELARIMLDKNREIVKQAMQIDELQKRVDAALSICNTSSFPLITWIDRALRGEE